jgi:hypothetical protein
MQFHGLMKRFGVLPKYLMNIWLPHFTLAVRALGAHRKGLLLLSLIIIIVVISHRWKFNWTYLFQGTQRGKVSDPQASCFRTGNSRQCPSTFLLWWRPESQRGFHVSLTVHLIPLCTYMRDECSIPKCCSCLFTEKCWWRCWQTPLSQNYWMIQRWQTPCQNFFCKSKVGCLLENWFVRAFWQHSNDLQFEGRGKVIIIGIYLRL